ncbi:MAG: Respiratory nitrate reductase delta chain [Nitrospira sp.]|jgi:nitrate reductase delta subunit|nr:MAG: Respiratory nitrate reductase delta chain [Nitrospira sp.]
MKLYKVIAVLLTYPEQDWLQSIGELRTTVAAETGRARRAGHRLDGLFTHFDRGPLIELQETYVETFDRNPAHSLSIFEHRMGESRERGEAMVRLVEEYREFGLEVMSHELPDFIPVFLEFLSLIPPEEAQRRLVGIDDVLQILRSRLTGAGSPYAGVFDALTALTSDAALWRTSFSIHKVKRFLRRMPSGIRIEVQGTLAKESIDRDGHHESRHESRR